MCFPKASRIKSRNGATVVEFAIVVPFVLAAFFAAFEFSRVAMIRHAADNAVYEGAREAIIPGGTANRAQARATELLSVIGVNDADIRIQPAAINDDTVNVTVRVSVGLDNNSLLPLNFFGGKRIVRELTMRREGSR